MPQEFSPVEPNQSIDQFCESEGISRSTYYGMKRDGTGPDELHAGNRRLITPEARRRWRKRRTVPVRGRPASASSNQSEGSEPPSAA